jgi:anti-sigma-K factor RskA
VNQIHESTGTYALDALDALDEAEFAEFEGHLAGCVTCSLEIAEFYETAAELTLLTEAQPPPELRDIIVSAVRNTTQLPAEGPLGPSAARPSRRMSRPTGPRRALPGSEVRDEAEPPVVDELALRRQRWRNQVLTGLVAAMLALMVGLGGVVYTLVKERQEQIAQTTLEEQLYEAPDVRTVTVPLEDGGQVTFIASKQLNRALFIGTDLPDPGPNNRYQLWTGTGEPTWKTATSVSRDNQVADPGPGSKVFFKGDIAGADFLCVNVEPLSNTTSTPTKPVLAAAEI